MVELVPCHRHIQEYQLCCIPLCPQQNHTPSFLWYIPSGGFQFQNKPHLQPNSGMNLYESYVSIETPKLQRWKYQKSQESVKYQTCTTATISYLLLPGPCYHSTNTPLRSGVVYLGTQRGIVESGVRRWRCNSGSDPLVIMRQVSVISMGKYNIGKYHISTGS